MRGAAQLLRRTTVGARKRCYATQDAGGPAGGEEGEKLGFVTALGGLVAASAGAIAVFGLGVLGVMGAAKGAASLLGHSLDAKRSGAAPEAPAETVAALRAELSALRAQPRSKESDTRKAAIKKQLLEG